MKEFILKFKISDNEITCDDSGMPESDTLFSSILGSYLSYIKYKNPLKYNTSMQHHKEVSNVFHNEFSKYLFKMKEIEHKKRLYRARVKSTYITNGFFSTEKEARMWVANQSYPEQYEIQELIENSWKDIEN